MWKLVYQNHILRKSFIYAYYNIIYDLPVCNTKVKKLYVVFKNVFIFNKIIYS